MDRHELTDRQHEGISRQPFFRWCLGMFPILTVTCARLAHREEREVEAAIGDEWRAYAASAPRWIPRLGRQHEAPTGRHLERQT